jgi:hypothetical protein
MRLTVEIKTSYIFVLLVTILFFPEILKGSAQITTTGSVEGVVLDLQGKPIPDANVYALPQGDMRNRFHYRRLLQWKQIEIRQPSSGRVGDGATNGIISEAATYGNRGVSLREFT